MQQLTPSPKAALLLDLKIVCGIGVANCSCHVATGAIWDYVRVPQVDPSMPTSYFGGYLALVGLSEMLLFVYLLLFYCCQRTDAKHLRSLRLVVSVIVTTISVAVLAMVSVKTDEYIAKGHSEEEKIFGFVIMVNVIDFFSTFFTIPGYIFLVNVHYRELVLNNSDGEVLETPNTQRGSSQVLGRQLRESERGLQQERFVEEEIIQDGQASPIA